MGFWNNGGFFSSVKGHVIKWWQFVLMPVLRINNNSAKLDKQAVQEPVKQPVQNEIPVPKEKTEDNASQQQVENKRDASLHQSKEKPAHEPTQQSEVFHVEQTKEVARDTEDAMEILRRINEEKENAQRKDIEKARQRAAEDARIAAIMNANKVDVNAFIEAGRAAKEEIAAKKAANEEQIRNELAQKKAIEVQQATVVKVAVDEELKKKRKQEEDLRRAQEIMDRLNREAAEDEAKKQAEIDAAKQEAKKHFG